VTFEDMVTGGLSMLVFKYLIIRGLDGTRERLEKVK
jgi:hypothetical protein